MASPVRDLQPAPEPWPHPDTRMVAAPSVATPFPEDSSYARSEKSADELILADDETIPSLIPGPDGQ